MESAGVTPETDNLAGHPDPAERLNEDDQAQRTADRFLQAAIGEQQRLAARAPRAEPGTCANCGERCLPAAVYCDAECREGHERRERSGPRRVGVGR
jgi:hypothetical protein